LAFTQQAIDNGLVQGYKTSNWDSVPEWAKAEDGLWMIAYTGATSFIFNNDLCEEEMPTSWEDVRKGSYKLTIGDVVGGATGQGVVVATAYAFGGDMHNLQPAFDFWTEMAKAGRIDKGDILLARIQAGEVQCGVTWSYNSPGYRDATPQYNMTVGIPTDGAILVGYASVISANSDTPFAAALAREVIFSDEGQIALAKAGAVPTRTNVQIPAEIAEATFDPSTYANAVGISDAKEYADVCLEVSEWWAENIIPLLD
jgi:putative spermidine/putrescine transport system substrate-binding protein